MYPQLQLPYSKYPPQYDNPQLMINQDHQVLFHQSLLRQYNQPINIDSWPMFCERRFR